MDTRRTFVIGDVHGCLDPLLRLVERIGWRPDEDGLIFLGDYIDRGRDSKGVVDYILALKDVSPHVRGIKGNHEVMFLDYLDRRRRDLYILNGGRITLESYGGTDSRGDIAVPRSHMAFYRSLPFVVELEDYIIVHAGLRPGCPLREQSEEDLVWIREPFIYSPQDFGKRVLFGHTPFREPLVMENKIGLDTGAVYGNRLTCLELPGLRFHSVEV